MPTRDISAGLARGRSVLGLLAFVILTAGTLVALMLMRTPAAIPSDQNAVTGAVASTPAPLTPARQAAVNAASALSKVDNARGSAMKTLVETYKVGCLQSSYIAFHQDAELPEKLDQRMTTAKIGASGWIDEGKVWAGTSGSALGAFHAEAAFDDGTAIWIVASTDKGPQAHEMVLVTSKSGKETWRLRDRVAKCDSTDPASDDDEGAG